MRSSHIKTTEETYRLARELQKIVVDAFNASKKQETRSRLPDSFENDILKARALYSRKFYDC